MIEALTVRALSSESADWSTFVDLLTLADL
jgi:hypothetical protein